MDTAYDRIIMATAGLPGTHPCVAQSHGLLTIACRSTLGEADAERLLDFLELTAEPPPEQDAGTMSQHPPVLERLKVNESAEAIVESALATLDWQQNEKAKAVARRGQAAA